MANARTGLETHLLFSVAHWPSASGPEHWTTLILAERGAGKKKRDGLLDASARGR